MKFSQVIGSLGLILLPNLFFAQDVLFPVRQGYVQKDSNLTIYSNVDYSFTITKDSIYLPYNTVQIITKEPQIVNGIPVSYMQLSDGSVARYAYTKQHGHMISFDYSNGRWMMWEHPQPVFKLIVLTGKKDE